MRTAQGPGDFSPPRGGGGRGRSDKTYFTRQGIIKTRTKKCFLRKTCNTHKFGRNGGWCVFNIVFGADREGGLLRGESAQPRALSAKSFVTDLMWLY